MMDIDKSTIMETKTLKWFVVILVMFNCFLCTAQNFKYQNYNLTVPHGQSFDISARNYWDKSLAYVIMIKPSITHRISYFLDTLNIDTKKIILDIWVKQNEDNLFVVDSITSCIHNEIDGGYYNSIDFENKVFDLLKDIQISMLYDPLELIRFSVPLFFKKEE